MDTHQIVRTATIRIAALFLGLICTVPLAASAESCNPNIPEYWQPGCVDSTQKLVETYTPPAGTSPYSPPTETIPYSPPAGTSPYSPPTETIPYSLPTEGPSWDKPAVDIKKEVLTSIPTKELSLLSEKATKIVKSMLKRSAIIILPQEQGKAFYLDPKTQMRASLGRPAEAFEVIRSYGIGIINKDLERIPMSTEAKEGDRAFACKQAGKIFLQVEAKGEAWYIHPKNCKRYFLNRPADAFKIMRTLALGVSHEDAALIPTTDEVQPEAANEKKEVQTIEPPKKEEVKKPSGVDTKSISNDVKRINDAIQKSIQSDAMMKAYNLGSGIW